MADQIVAVTSNPNQKLTVNLNVDGGILTLQLGIYYSEMAGYWVMDISDAGGNPILTSIPMVTGEWPAANFLAPYAYLAIGSAYLINSSGVNEDMPTSNDLGVNFSLLWSDTAA